MKILVAIPTYAGGTYCREVLLKYLNSLSTQNLAFVFVTNSGEEDYKALVEQTTFLKEKGSVAVLLNEEQCSEGLDQVVSNRNMLREYFLNGDWDYLYFLDHDVIGPKNAIDIMLKHQKAVVSGWYLGAFLRNEKMVMKPLAYLFADAQQQTVKQMNISEVLSPKLQKAACAGLGCTLIAKNILEKVSFRRENGTEDAAFYKDVRKDCGEDLWIDTRIAYWHLKFPSGDKRNALYDPRNYTKK